MVSNSEIRKLTEFIPDFKSRIERIPTRDIENNPFNPRKKFGQEEEDELLESIASKGILQPIIVFEKKGSKGKYVLLDGQRRFHACRKLGIEEIPAHVLVKEPDFIENLSIMFHIHNVQEDWTELAIATSIEKIIQELGIDKNKPSSEDIKTLKKLTSLSAYKIKKYIDVLRYPQPVIDRFMESELQERPELDVDLLSELRGPIKKLKKILPEVIENYPEEKIVDIFIEKKKRKVIPTNKEIRKLSKILANVGKGKIDQKVVKEKIVDFFENRELSLDQIYSDTAEAIEQVKIILKMSERLRREIDNVDLRKVPEEERTRLREELEDLLNSIKRKT